MYSYTGTSRSVMYPDLLFQLFLKVRSKRFMVEHQDLPHLEWAALQAVVTVERQDRSHYCEISKVKG